MGKSEYLEKSKTYKGFHYSVLDPEMLDYLHKRALEMFIEVKKIFEKNDISYMICGGTLLGAIGGNSQGGFIPWDDDLDLCVFEEDYERAIESLIVELKEGMEVQCTRTDSNYYLGWIKVRDQHSHVYPDAPKFKENGVWIDIYKLVKTKAGEVPVMIDMENIEYLKRRLAVGGLTKEEYESRLRDGKLKERLEKSKKEASIHKDGSEQNDVYIIWSASKIVLNEEWVKPISKTTFENITVSTFAAPEKYLIRHYGNDYKEFPPDEMRRVGINRIDIADAESF